MIAMIWKLSKLILSGSGTDRVAHDIVVGGGEVEGLADQLLQQKKGERKKVSNEEIKILCSKNYTWGGWNSHPPGRWGGWPTTHPIGFQVFPYILNDRVSLNDSPRGRSKSNMYCVTPWPRSPVCARGCGRALDWFWSRKQGVQWGEASWRRSH